jgi:hypothetical protein
MDCLNLDPIVARQYQPISAPLDKKIFGSFKFLHKVKKTDKQWSEVDVPVFYENSTRIFLM